MSEPEVTRVDIKYPDMKQCWFCRTRKVNITFAKVKVVLCKECKLRWSQLNTFMDLSV